MEHPAGKYKTPLLALRIVQVVIAVINAIVAVLLVAAVSTVFHQARRDPNVRDDPAAKAYIGGAIGGMVFGLVLAFACVITCTLWLYYTAKPHARLRSCGGNKPACMRYSCDMGWDIFWAILWGTNVIIYALSRSSSVAMKIGNIVTSLIIMCLFVSTAILSGKVRRNLRAAVAAAPKDIEAQPCAPVPPVVMGAPTTAHT